MMKHNNVTRILSCLLAAIMVFTLAACGRTEDTRGTQPEERQESSQPVTESAESSTAQGGSKILIAYFTADEYDFSGKTIIPINVHNGSRFSGTIDTIKELEPGATDMEDGFTVSERDVADAAEDVAEWLNGLGY